VPGLVAREIALDSWHWPEKMAARMLNLSMWDAGQHLMAADSADGWNGLVASSRLVAANKDTLEGCRRAAAKVRDTVRRKIRVGAALSGA
jgi:hypothetical protein